MNYEEAKSRAKRLILIGDVRVVLTQPQAGVSEQNLYAFHRSGQLLWQAPLPGTGPDVFVDAEIREGKLLAWTWTCMRYEIEPQTGAILDKVFTK